MKKQIQTASEAKYSNRASTLAHETRKNQQWLSMLVIAAFAISVAFTSCGKDGGGGNGKGGEVGVVTQITAKIEKASQHSAVVKVKLNVLDINIGCYATLAEAELKSGGFTLQLPGTVPERFLVPIDDAEFLLFNAELTYSDNNAKVLPLPYFVGYNSAGRHISMFLIREKNLSSKHYIYADHDVNVSGSSTLDTGDNEPDVVVSVDLKLKKGWNVYYFGSCLKSVEFILGSISK